MQKFLLYRPEIVSFFSGALVMVFEIVGARIIGPYLGTSLFVWTSIIAIILAALSLGYYYGGKLSDTGANIKELSLIFLISSGLFLFLFLFKDITLFTISKNIADIRLSSIVVSSFLFIPVSFVLGMVSPIAIKIQLHDLEKSGEVVGRIGSIGTIGSIIGTLGAGFVLIPFFGVNTLILLLACACLLLSLLCEFRLYLSVQIFITLLLSGGFFIEYQQKISLAQKGIHIFDTSYSHITIEDSTFDGKAVRNLKIDDVVHAGMYIDSPELLHNYTKYYHLFDVLVPQAKNIVMFGGAAYSFPKSFLATYTDKKLDVVEIDPGITQIAKDYFGLIDNANLRIQHQDARVFLNTSPNKYDVILGDAFGSYYSIPYQLTTIEAAQEKYNMLTENGIVILNVISALAGEKGEFLAAEYKTYKEVFPEVFVIPVRDTEKTQAQNIMLVAAKNPDILNFETKNSQYQSYLAKKTYLTPDEKTIVLSDDFAPVNSYISKLLD